MNSTDISVGSAQDYSCSVDDDSGCLADHVIHEELTGSAISVTIDDHWPGHILVEGTDEFG